MELLPVVAPLLVAAGAVLLCAARRPLALEAGLLTVLLLLPLCGRPYPTSTGWALGAGVHLVATLLGGFLLWVGIRGVAPPLPEARTLAPLVWTAIVAFCVVAGVAAWPLLIEWLDPLRLAEGRLAGWLEPPRWALGAALALLAVGLGRLLVASDPPRLAAGAALVAAAAWLTGVSAGPSIPDLALPAVSLVLPAAGAPAAWRSLQRA